MTSELQVRANQQNAQLSTGPKTKAGKRKVSLNRITHGLRAEPVVIADEDAQAFEETRATLQAALRPVGELETMLAERAVVALWQLIRVLGLEGRLLLARQATEDTETPEQALEREMQLVSFALPGLTRYESQIERQFSNALGVLHMEQQRRTYREEGARQTDFVRDWNLRQGEPLPQPTAGAIEPQANED